MLPDFPKLKLERFNRLLAGALKEARIKQGAISTLRTRKQHEGESLRSESIEGVSSQTIYEDLGATLMVHPSELPLLDDTKWIEKINAFTNSIAEQEARLMIRKIDESCKSTGSVVNAGSEPLSEKHVLQLFASVQLDFEGDDIAPGFTFLTSPELGKRLSELKLSPEAEEEYERIIEDQRIEWRLRQANRKLVD